MDLNTVLTTLASYLPPQLGSALLSVSAALPSSLSLPSSISSLLPILLSLTTLYFTLLSLYSTTRFALRLAWWSLKWGTLAAAVATAYSGWSTGGANGTGGWAEGARNLATASSSVYGVGRRGIEWWAQNGGWGANNDAPGAAGRGSARRTGKGRRGTPGSRSASGAPRTWAAASDDGGWDTPGDVADPDPIKYIQKSLLTFLNSPPPPVATPEKKARKGKTSVETSPPAMDLGAMAIDFAMGKARKIWDDLTRGVFGSLDGQVANRRGAR